MFDDLLINIRLNQDGVRDGINGVGSALKGLKNSIGGLNQVIGMGKMYMLSGGMAKVIKSALDMTETINLFNVSMGDMAVTTNETLEELSRVSGLDLTNLQEATATFANLARSMEMSTGQSSKLGLNMTQLAVDLSSLRNVPIDRVMQDLRSGLLGQSETVYKYGMDVTEAGIKTEAMAQGISKSVREMSQGEKMALRYSVMIKQSGLAQGDFANTIETPANQLRILSERFITLGRSIGSIFMPLLGAVLPYLNAFVQILTDVANAIAKFFGFKAPKVENTTKSARGGISSVGKDLDGTTGKAKKTTKALKDMKNATMGFDEINLLPKDKPTADAGAGGGAGGGMGDSILPTFDLPSYESMMKGIKQRSDEIKKSMLESIQAIKDFVNSIPIEPIVFLAGALAGLWALGMIGSLAGVLLDIAIAFEGLSSMPIIGGFFATLSELALNLGISFEALAVTISGMTAGALALIIGIIALVITTIVSLWNNVKSFRDSWTTVWNNIKDILSTVWNGILKPIFKSLVDTCRIIYDAGIKPLWNAWLVMWTAVSSIITTILNGIIFPLFKVFLGWITKNIVPIVQALMPVFAIVFSGIAGAVGGAFRTIADVFNSFKRILDGIINFVTGVFTGNWRRAWQGVKQIFTGIFSGLNAVFKLPINLMIEAVNGLIRGLNKIKLPDWDIIPSGMRGKGFSFHEIPRLARGGMLGSGGLFEAGENGKAEMIGSYQGKTTVMPLENTSFVSSMADAVYGAVTSAMANSNGGSGGSGDLILQVGSTEFGRVAVDSINKLTKQEGRLALNI